MAKHLCPGRKTFLNTLLLASALLLGSGEAWATSPHSVHIKIEGMKFNPSSVTVKKGDTVIWDNEDLVPHTATEKNHAFDSKTINQGKKFKYKATRAGTFTYSCIFHPTMTGTLTVSP